MTHTPGPWEWQEWEDGTIAIETADGTPDIIARQTGILPADARLVAAAPELLALLRRFYDATYGRTDLIPALDFEQARTAIGKATEE